MNAKTIIAIVLVVFIVGAAIWLNVRKRCEDAARHLRENRQKPPKNRDEYER